MKMKRQINIIYGKRKKSYLSSVSWSKSNWYNITEPIHFTVDRTVCIVTFLIHPFDFNNLIEHLV